MTLNLDSKVPEGPMADKWSNYIASQKLVNPANKRKFKIIVVGTGLAGASAAATFGELGYQVESFTFHDSPRRAHSIAAQGGINASKNYQGDGDSVHRLFYDTVKGGDFRSREANVHRLAEAVPAISSGQAAAQILIRPFMVFHPLIYRHRPKRPRRPTASHKLVKVASQNKVRSDTFPAGTALSSTYSMSTSSYRPLSTTVAR